MSDSTSDAGPFLRVPGPTGDAQVPLGHRAVCRIGRGADNDVVVTDGAASRDHAMIRRDDRGDCVLTDSGSRNGTLLNGRPVTAPARLADGDVVAIGAQQLHFVRPQGTGGAPSPFPPEAAAAAATMFMPQQSLISVLVVDIRGFTPLSRAIGEERLSALMATIFRKAGALLAHAGCWSEKFIGDAIMGVWKNEQNRLLGSELARMLDTIVALERLFAGMQGRFALPYPLAFGAAINTGLASIGNMGSGNAADFTALGDAVNKTFRLETASKALGADVVIGEATMTALVPPLPPEALPPAGQAVLKGYDTAEPVRLLRFADVAPLSRRLAG